LMSSRTEEIVNRTQRRMNKCSPVLRMADADNDFRA
jgi:hypothetical protein